jgi:hypothetical protein
MKTSRRLLGAAGLSMTAAALFMGVGTASADCTTDICINPGGPGGGPNQALYKIDLLALKFAPDSLVAYKLETVANKLTSVLQKFNPTTNQ